MKNLLLFLLLLPAFCFSQRFELKELTAGKNSATGGCPAAELPLLLAAIFIILAGLAELACWSTQTRVLRSGPDIKGAGV